MSTTDNLIAATPLVLQIATVTDVGDRATNQDALACAQKDHLTCLVVSDGAGGHAGGEVASRLVVDAITDSFLRELSFSPRALQSYLQHATEHVAAGRRDTGMTDMSATVAVVLIDQDNHSALCGHLGDTRIYIFRAGRLHHVTKDHSLVQQFVDAGYLSADKIRTHPKRSILFAAIGPEHEQAPIVSTEAIALTAGDALLICTDGLWEWLSDDDILQCLQRSQDPHEWLAGLCEQAKLSSDSGSSGSGNNSSEKTPRERDNYSAQAIWFSSSTNLSTAS